MALEESEIQKLRLTLSSSGWTDVMQPRILQRGRAALEALVETPNARTGEFKGMSDEDLRSRIRECEWMSVAWSNEVTVFDLNRARDELVRRQDPPAPNA